MKYLLQNKIVPLMTVNKNIGVIDKANYQKKSKSGSDKTKQTFFRASLKNNYSMLEAVDRKGNILVSINTLVLSVILGTGFTSSISLTMSNFHILTLVIFCVVSTLLALKAIKPFVLNPSQVGMKNNSMLNLEVMKGLKVNEYKLRLNSIIEKDKSIYNSMAEEMYFIGQNINSKHKYLYFSSLTFIGGIVLSLILILV
jgi:hypothetical protein